MKSISEYQLQSNPALDEKYPSKGYSNNATYADSNPKGISYTRTNPSTLFDESAAHGGSRIIQNASDGNMIMETSFAN